MIPISLESASQKPRISTILQAAKAITTVARPASPPGWRVERLEWRLPAVLWSLE
jgi:hypothetical protein